MVWHNARNLKIEFLDRYYGQANMIRVNFPDNKNKEFLNFWLKSNLQGLFL